MRLMSFAVTKNQILDGSKTVTRRIGWATLKPGEYIQAVEKRRGLKRGEKIQKLAKLRIEGVRLEPLDRMVKERDYGRQECELEGFPGLAPDEFVRMFRRENRDAFDSMLVTRIEFSYLGRTTLEEEERLAFGWLLGGDLLDLVPRRDRSTID